MSTASQPVRHVDHATETIPLGHHFIITNTGEIHGQDTEESRTIARRVQACVNACVGLTTPDLEAGIIQDMQRVIADVTPILQEQLNLTRHDPEPAD